MMACYLALRKTRGFYFYFLFFSFLFSSHFVKTRQDKTRQDKTRQDKTSQVKRKITFINEKKYRKKINCIHKIKVAVGNLKRTQNK